MAKIKATKGTTRNATQHGNSNSLLSPEEHRRMIAEAAYFRALQRGFSGGDPCDDWLVAEREINQALPDTLRHPR